MHPVVKSHKPKRLVLFLKNSDASRFFMAIENPFPHPTRQSLAAIIFILGKVSKMLLKQFWVVVMVIVFNPKRRAFDTFTAIFLLMAVFGAALSIINYFYYFFYIRGGELIMEKGILRKVKVNVPLGRIQTVNFKQGVLHQALNVVAVDIDTAGSADIEFSLQAISRERAESLRNFIEQSKTAEGADIGDADEPGESATDSPVKETNSSVVPIFQMTATDLFKIGIGQNHLRTTGIIFAFLIGVANNVEEALNLNFSEKIEEWIGSSPGVEFFYYLLIALPFVLIFSFLITLVRTWLRYYNLQFWRTIRGFKITSGLFTRYEVSASLQKIQFVRWDSSPVMRLFGMMMVRLPQAASVKMHQKMIAGMPGCYQAQLEAVREAYFPEEKNLPHEERGVNRRIIRRRFLLTGVLPVAALMLFSYSWLGSSIWIWVLWLAPAFWLSVKFHRNWRWRITEESIHTTEGALHRTDVLLQWYKVQSVQIRQSIFLRKAGLAHIIFFTAAGSVKAPYIPIATAQALRDFVLYKIETDEREWM